MALNAAESINDLRVPPGNRLEMLAGTRAGQYSIHVNDQWRICFTWSASGAGNVELVDYHWKGETDGRFRPHPSGRDPQDRIP